MMVLLGIAVIYVGLVAFLFVICVSTYSWERLRGDKDKAQLIARGFLPSVLSLTLMIVAFVLIGLMTWLVGHILQKWGS